MFCEPGRILRTPRDPSASLYLIHLTRLLGANDMFGGMQVTRQCILIWSALHMMAQLRLFQGSPEHWVSLNTKPALPNQELLATLVLRLISRAGVRLSINSEQ